MSIAYQATPPGSRCYAGRFLGAPTGFPPSLPGVTSSRRSSVEDQTRKGLLNILFFFFKYTIHGRDFENGDVSFSCGWAKTEVFQFNEVVPRF